MTEMQDFFFPHQAPKMYNLIRISASALWLSATGILEELEKSISLNFQVRDTHTPQKKHNKPPTNNPNPKPNQNKNKTKSIGQITIIIQLFILPKHFILTVSEPLLAVIKAKNF